MVNTQSPFQSYDPSFFTRLFRVEDRHFWFRGRNSAIAVLAKRLMTDLPPDLTVLELGCGTGNILRVLGRVCDKGIIVGMDIFLEGLRYARQRTGALLVQGDIYKPPFGARFNLIGLFDVLEHLPDDRRILHDLHDLLTRDGRLLITVPAHQYLWSYFDEASHHYRRYERGELLQKLEESGYQVEQASYFMASIFPLVYIGRRLSWLLKKRGRTCQVTRPNKLAVSELRIIPVINEIISMFLVLESRLLTRRKKLPWGASLLAVARKDSR